jgi:hypothetical protein
MLPFVAGAAAVPIASGGAALGHVVLHLRGEAAEPRVVFWVAVVAAASLPAAAGYEIWHGKSLERAVAEVRQKDAVDADVAFRTSRFRRDKYYLGALAENRAASPALLQSIASVDDPALFEAMWSFWNVMGENRKGLAVMRLVARHRNISGATLAQLEAHPESGKLITELLANPNIPQPVLARHYDDTHYLAEWGLSMNPKTPPAVMERLARSSNVYTRLNLVLYNPATPQAIVERLANDDDAFLAQKARERLKNR